MDKLYNNDVSHTRELINKTVAHIRAFNSTVVAFSGGVDSSVLAALSYMALGDKTVAITVNSQILHKRELESAKQTAQSIGIKHIIIAADELRKTRHLQNPPDRCYHCKSGMFKKLNKLAAELGFETVVDGTNASDFKEDRPGYKAVLEYGISTPFTDLNITKDEIRSMGHMLGLSVWNKPNQTCLLTRFAYGRTITVEKLMQVEKAEDYLNRQGIGQFRVRDHDDIARIEVIEKDFNIIIKNKDRIVNYFKELGYDHVTFDLENLKKKYGSEISNDKK